MKKTFKKGGIHPVANKIADAGIRVLPLPSRAVLPLAQHIGAPARPVVAKGDTVSRGQLVAEGGSFVSAGIHASVSGTVASIGEVLMPSGVPGHAIVINTTPESLALDEKARSDYWERIASQEADRTLSDRFTAGELRSRISAAGVVGLGGATFPAHVKLSLRPDVKAEVLVVNGCECEPYLMCDDALMRAYPGQIAEGVELMMKAAGISRAIIGIEDNKPEAIAALRAALEGSPFNITVEVLRTKYPQGGEKQLVEAVTGRRIPSGALPVSVGAVVQNVATAFAVYQAVAFNMPLIERVITLTGDIPESERGNYRVALGTLMSDLPFSVPDDGKVILGGPMMGRSAVCLDAPVMKGTSGLTVLAGSRRRPVQPCVRCGACVDACPMGLEPYLLARYGELRKWEDAAASDVADCLECGACSYSCPSARPLLDFIRLGRLRARDFAK